MLKYLIPPTLRSFDLVGAEVRTQLSHLSRQKKDAIVSVVETSEPTVFETRTMPRLAPHREWELDMTDEGTWPPVHTPVPHSICLS